MMTLDVTGLRELDWRLRMMLVRARSELPDAMQTLATDMAKTARHEIGHEWQRWAPLAASTVREKRRHGWTGRISATDPLLASGRMRRSIYGEGRELVAEVRADGPALFHEEGTRRMPARPFLKPAVAETAPVARRLLAETLRVAITES